MKSQFGWHIIRVDDLRDAQLPSLDDIKPQIAEQLEQQMMQFQESTRQGQGAIATVPQASKKRPIGSLFMAGRACALPGCTRPLRRRA